jgi:hypothetical protein
VFGTAELRHLGDHDSAARTHQQIGGPTQRRVRRQSREAVGAAAFHSENQLAHGDWRALCLIEDRQHRRHFLETAVDHGLRPADLLDTEANDRPAEIAMLFLEVLLDRRQVRLLAPEADENNPADVRVARVVGQRAEQDLDVRSIRATATLVVRNRDHAVHVGEAFATVEREFGDRRDLLGLVARAHAGWDDEQEVPRPGASIGAPISHPGRHLGRRKIVRRRRAQIGRQIAHDWNVVAHVLERDRVAFGDPA